MQKVLEDANLKLAAVPSDPRGGSARAMLKALAEGQEDPKALAQLARRRLRSKIPELEQALEETEVATSRLEERIEWLVGQGPLEPPPGAVRPG